MKFRKKPVTIEAHRWQGDIRALMRKKRGEAPPPSGKVDLPIHVITGSDHLEIDTLEGAGLVASLGDWIICGVKGEFYPCKPDIFEATYERIETAAREGTDQIAQDRRKRP